MFNCKIIEDSISQIGTRLTTFQVEFPRSILAEFSKHRMFSISAKSSRAVPVKRIIEEIENDPVMPIEYCYNQKGMVAGELMEENTTIECEYYINKILENTLYYCSKLNELNLSKQVVNRYLEPFMTTSVVVTATDWKNFFRLRTADDAEPNFQKIAKMIYEEYKNSSPKELSWNQWHLPYIQENEKSRYSIYNCRKMSVARCARVSYNNHDKSEPNPDKDIELCHGLEKNKHLAPFEHQATPMRNNQYIGNFKGWMQYRKLIKFENGEY